MILLHEGVHAFIYHLSDMRTGIFGEQVIEPYLDVGELFESFAQMDDKWKTWNEWYVVNFIEFPVAKQAGEVTRPRTRYTSPDMRLPWVPDVISVSEVKRAGKKKK